MSSLISNATIKIRQDSASNWTSTNPTPLQGEWCLETDTGRTKIGDGSTAWASLIYKSNNTTEGYPVTALRYTTGWVANSTWDRQDFNIAHNLNAYINELNVQFLISKTGSDTDSFEPVSGVRQNGSGTEVHTGFTKETVDLNNVNIITGNNGLPYMADTYAVVVLHSEAYYYKVVVTKLIINE